ncbi:MAG: bifunctional riboflavin kinase/FAD synthetase, partial [Betaproteobacteria bacterium]|nr:bifunctional riboflavin kinase/FAD synthetase [Betaproteobacteria bacterium]
MRVTRGLIADPLPKPAASPASGGRSAAALPPGSRARGSRGTAVTIGNFDGAHVGHQAMLARLLEVARARQLTSCVLTFEPHPRELFAPGQAPTRLTSLREKLELLSVYGVERTHVVRFSRAFAAIPAEAFIDRMLIGTLDARWVLVGGDFRFGARRGGDVALLRAMGELRGFEVEVMPEVMQGRARVASSAVREALKSGDLKAASLLLGRSYTISGRVVH